jgi:hypothetical protein
MFYRNDVGQQEGSNGIETWNISFGPRRQNAPIFVTLTGLGVSLSSINHTVE